MAAQDFFFPLQIGDTFQRVWTIFRQRWVELYLTSTLAIVLWYVVAVGIRHVFQKWSENLTELRYFDMNGTEFAFQWQLYRTTISRLGLCLEFLLVYLLHLPADATNIHMIAHVYAGNESITPQKAFKKCVFPRITSLLIACLGWCTILLLPLGILILCMAPEGQEHVSGIELYTYPRWFKLCGGLLFMVFSTIFMIATYFVYSFLVVNGGGKMEGFQALKQSVSVIQKGGWQHVSTVLFLWFLVKVLITKFVSALNFLYYERDVQFWTAWAEPGIPLHPIRIIASSMDLWQIGRSWISVPFVILFASMGSVFQAVLYIDSRVKGEGYTHKDLCDDLGLDEGVAAMYSTMNHESEKVEKDGAMA